MIRGRSRARVALAAGLLITASCPAAAQRMLPDSVAWNACLDTIPAREMKRVVVYSAGEIIWPGRGAGAPARTAILAFNRLLAHNARLMLGQGAEGLPAGEPLISWTGIEGGLRITARRDGRLTWTGQGSERDSTAGAKLLRTTLTRLAEAGASFEWPGGLSADSVIFDIDLASPSYDRNWKQTDPEVEAPEPIFTVAVPWREPARYLRGVLHYPPVPRADTVAGHVDLAYVVDTSGRADVSTARDLWPPNRPRLTGRLGRYYADFVDAIKQTLPNFRYEPARIGGCPVRMWVQQSFIFKMDPPSWPPPPAPPWPPPPDQ